MRHPYPQCKAIELKRTLPFTGTTSPLYLAVPYNLAEDRIKQFRGEAHAQQSLPQDDQNRLRHRSSNQDDQNRLQHRSSNKIASLLSVATEAALLVSVCASVCVGRSSACFQACWKEARSVLCNFHIMCERKLSICHSRYQHYFKVESSSQLGTAIHKYTEVLLASVAAAQENLYMLQQPITPRRRGIVLQYIQAG